MAYRLVGHLIKYSPCLEPLGASRSLLGTSYLSSGLPFGKPPDKYLPCCPPWPCLPQIHRTQKETSTHRAQPLAELSLTERSEVLRPSEARCSVRAKRGVTRASRGPPRKARGDSTATIQLLYGQPLRALFRRINTRAGIYLYRSPNNTWCRLAQIFLADLI